MIPQLDGARRGSSGPCPWTHPAPSPPRRVIIRAATFRPQRRFPTACTVGKMMCCLYVDVIACYGQSTYIMFADISSCVRHSTARVALGQWYWRHHPWNTFRFGGFFVSTSSGCRTRRPELWTWPCLLWRDMSRLLCAYRLRMLPHLSL